MAGASSKKQYAKALFAAAKDPLAIRNELTALADVVSGTPAYKQILLDVSLAAAPARAGVVKRLVPKASPLLQNLLALLSAERSVDELPGLAREYSELVKTRLNLADVTIESAHPLSRSERDRLTKALPLAGRTPIVTVRTNRDLLGGARVTVDDVTYDATIAGALDQLAAGVA